MIAFSPIIDVHSSRLIGISLRFEDPSFLSVGGVAFLSLLVKEPSLFKSAKSLKPLDASSLVSGKPLYKEELPPLIAD